MAEEEKHILNTISAKIDHLTENVETIRRGVYGDKDNNVLGLIQRQEIDEQERKRMDGEINIIKNKNWKLSVLFGLAGSLAFWIIKFLLA